MKKFIFAIAGLFVTLAVCQAQVVGGTSGSIRASSTLADPDNPGHYLPAKAFDGNPLTIWAEGADGPGIGETIEIEFDQEIQADAVSIMPGFFNPKWWAPNNRVKRATLFFNKYSMQVDFTNAMKAQPVNLPKTLMFKTFSLRIDAVYPGDAYDDTCISEIQFRLEGKPVLIDRDLLNRSLKEIP